MGGFEGYFSYDQSVLQYVTGGSVASGNDDEIHIRDTEREETSTRIKYAIKFRARKAGTCRISLKKPYTVYGTEDDEKMSVGAAGLTLEILSSKDILKTAHPQKEETEKKTASMTPEEQQNPGMPDQSSPLPANAPTEGADREMPLKEEEQDETGEEMQSAEKGQEESAQSSPSESVSAQEEEKNAQGISRQTCIIVICFCVTGLVMIAILSGSLWNIRNEEETEWEEQEDETEQNQEEIPIEQEESMTEIEQRLEKKRDWLKK
jgi:preprotein translocase subunit SecG